MGATDQISNPFAVVTDHHKIRNTTNHGNTTKQNAEQPVASEEDFSPLSQSNHLNRAADNSFVNTPKQSTNIGRSGVQTDIFDSERTADSDSLKMPTRLNSHKNGLRQSPRFHEQQDMEESKKRKVHVTFVAAAATKILFRMFSLIALASNITMPEHQTMPRV